MVGCWRGCGWGWGWGWGLGSGSMELFSSRSSGGTRLDEPSFGRVIADQINSLGPDLAPDVHVVAQIDGTADPTASGPDELCVVGADRS